MLAILAHAAPTPDLWVVVEEAILAVTSGAVGPDIPLALLILSLAPSPTDTTRAPMTALRTIALAYSVGQMMGWDAMSQVWHQSEWLTLPAWSTRFDQVLLWETVKNRYNMYVTLTYQADSSLCLMQGMSPALAISLAKHLPSNAPDHYIQSIAFMKSEARLVEIFSPILPHLCVAEIESHTSAMDATPMLDAWRTLILEFDHWKSDDKIPSSEFWFGNTNL